MSPMLPRYDPFTKELIEIWLRLNFKRQPCDFSSIPIWYSSLVQIDNKPCYYKNWYKEGNLFRNHLLDENLHLSTFFLSKLISSSIKACKCSLQNEINLRLLSGSDKHCRSKKSAGFNGVLQVSI